MTAARALWQALIRFEPQKIVTQVAIRNTIGFTLAVILGTAFSSPSTGVVAGLGALNVAYSDGVDPYRFRARRMLIGTVLSGAAVVMGALSAHSNIAAVAIATAWAFAAGMLVALGTTAADIGVITLVTLVVFAAKPLAPLEAIEAGGVAIGGGLLQTLLSNFLWPIRRYQPESRIIAGIYSELAAIAKAPPPPAKAPPMTGQISDAQDALAPLSHSHSIEAERHVFLLVQAERIRLSILNAGRLQRRLGRHEGGAQAAEVMGRVLAASSGALEVMGQLPLFGAAIDQLNASLVELQAIVPPDDSAFFAALLRGARHQAGALRSQIRSAGWAATASTPHGFWKTKETVSTEPQPWRLRFQGYRARLLANLSIDSTVFRHALRMAVCLGIGDIIGRTIVLQRTYWIPMTIAIVLKPDFTSTFARGVLRIGGTMAGLVFATVLFHFVHVGVQTDILLMAVFVLLLRWVGPANYGVFVAAISALVVLLIAVTGIAPQAVIGPRALNTVLGGCLALVAYAIWPTWERTQTREALAGMLDAYRAYTQAVLGAWLGMSPSVIDQVRVKGRRARSNAEASVDRMTGEPGVTAKQAASLNSILVHSHSFVAAVMAMESHLHRQQRDPMPSWMPAFAVSVDKALAKLSDLTGPGLLKLDVEMPAPGTGGNELLETEADRIRTSLRSLSEELAKRDWL